MKPYVYVLCALFFFSNCASDGTPPPTLTKSYIDSSIQLQDSNIMEAVQTIESTKEMQEVVQSKYAQIETQKEYDGRERTTYVIKREVLDSLNHVVLKFDTTIFNQVSVSYFSTLSNNLNGETFFVKSADQLIPSLMKVLSTRTEDLADVVFLIDKTGSMDDDIAEVRRSLDLIINRLETFKGVRLGIATYGDKNWHYDAWYNQVPLTKDANEIRYFLNSFSTIGNPDIAESVNDAIVETVKTMNWEPGHRRILIVIGDAPSKEPPLAEYSTKDVISICKQMNVAFNIYPLIVNANASGFRDKVFKTDFANIYPNPVKDNMNFSFTQSDRFNYTLFDMHGQLIMEGQFPYGNSGMLNMKIIPNGTYVLEVFNSQNTLFYSKKIVVAHD